ncbi:MAG: caspase family protein [Rhizobiaceae bacterium]
MPTLHRLLGIVAIVGLCWIHSGIAHAEKRVALVIGNSAYSHVPELANPKNDAADMAAKLVELGFEVVQGEDLDLQSMRRTVRDFVNRLDGADLSLFFYAGHGLQVNGGNYMAPIDAQLANYNDLDFEMLPMDLVLSAMERSTKTNLIFLDACRDNPLAENLARSMGTRSGSVGRGLAKFGSGIGSLIAFSTQPGNVALDGKGRNSPFTTALLSHLGTPGLSITDELVAVRRDVLAATDGKQVPWDNSSLTGPVVLKEAPAKEPKQEAAMPAQQTSQPALQQNDTSQAQFEITFWNSIKDADSKAYFETYLTRYPSGQFVDIAKLKIAELEARIVKDASDAELARVQDEQKKVEAAKLAQQDKQANDEANAIAEQAAAKQAAELKAAEDAAQKAEEARIAAEEARKALEQRLADLEAAQKQREAELSIAKAEADKRIEVARLEQSSDVEAQTRSMAPEELARATQSELLRLGCLSGRVDGKWGSSSQRSLRAYADRQGVKLASLDPAIDLLDRLKATNVRVCPLICGKGMEESNGRCVKVKQEAKVDPKPEKRQSAQSTSPIPLQSSRPEAPSKKVAGGRTCKMCKALEAGMIDFNHGFRKKCLSELEWAQMSSRFWQCK